MQQIRRNRLQPLLICCLFLGIRHLCAEHASVTTNVIAVRPLSSGQPGVSVVAYFEREPRTVFHLALSGVRDSTALRTNQVIFSKPWSRNWDECDVWVTPSTKTLCLLLGEKSKGYGHIYELLFLRYDVKTVTAELYPRHVSRRTGELPAQTSAEDKTKPLPVNTILRAYLESDGQTEQHGRQKIAVRNMADVHFVQGHDLHDCEVVGTINGTWRFSLRISLDEENGDFDVGIPTVSELTK